MQTFTHHLMSEVPVKTFTFFWTKVTQCKEWFSQTPKTEAQDEHKFFWTCRDNQWSTRAGGRRVGGIRDRKNESKSIILI